MIGESVHQQMGRVDSLAGQSHHADRDAEQAHENRHFDGNVGDDGFGSRVGHPPCDRIHPRRQVWLISCGAVRAERRQLDETALDTAAPLHHLAGDFARMIAEEAATLADEARPAGRLDAAEFTRWWWLLVRRIVLGDAARNNNSVTDDLWRLRKSGNWSFLGLSHVRLRERFFDRLFTYADVADPQSLIGTLAQLPAHGSVDAVGHVLHWLFAFDAAGMAALRAVAVLATHPEERSRCETGELEQLKLRPFLRACVLESIRLWPATPAILRELTANTTFGAGTRFASGSSVLIATPAFQRDPDLLPFANDFVPDIWVDGRPEQYPQLVPFSAGPAECPGRNLCSSLPAPSSLICSR